MPGKTRTSLSIGAIVQLPGQNRFTRIRQAGEHARIVGKVIQPAEHGAGNSSPAGAVAAH
jgi:hypothetical protein